MKKINLFNLKPVILGFLILSSSTLSANQNAKIIAGPYLLAPTSSSMTVMWETNQPEKTSISISDGNKTAQKENVSMYKGTECPSQPDGINLYKKVFNNLKPNQKYDYTVDISSGEKISGNFKTLQEKPKAVQFMIITDTHNFETAPELTKVILKLNPEFIVHTGDMVLGTGYSKSEFNQYWFDKGKGFLKYIPVIYAPGNHDHGPFVEDYFTKAQSKIYHTDKTGNNVSFNYGNVHFIIMDSNPWGLLKMGAVKAGLPVTRKIQKLVTDAKDWLTEDLQSDNAKKADWRFLFMHHPYIDDMTRKEIVPIAEKYNVDTLFAGHKHKYYKNISTDYKVGANTLYVDLPTALQHESKIDFGKDGKSPVSGFPEILATGLGDFSIVTVTGDETNIKICSLDSTSANEYKILDTIKLSSEENTKISYSNIQITPDEINSGNSITISTTAANTGKGLEAVTLNITDNDNTITKYVIGNKDNAQIAALNPGESRNLKVTIPLYSPGNHKISFSGIEKNITVKAIPDAYLYKNLKIAIPDSNNSDIVIVSIDVFNKGNQEGTIKVPLQVNGKIAADKEITLKPLETKTLNFAHNFSDSGIYSIKAGESSIAKIRVYGTVSGTPYLIDKSGNNNNGLIRGNPKVVDSPYGKALFLDGKRDYIEVPDSSSFRFNEGWTGIVLAEAQKIAPPEVKDHNPLLQKGPSIGWGPNYTVRMALRRTGLMTWGTSTGTDEFFWDGGKYPLKKWAYYTASYNKKTGGRGYIDKDLVAETITYGNVGSIQNWKNFPLFCGFAYIGHVDPILGRAKQYTMFNGKIGEIRFYNKGLDEKVIISVNQDIEKAGIEENHLITWLSPNQIENKGTHTTDWRMPIDFVPSYNSEKDYWNWDALTAEVKIPETAKITGRIQVSDDAALVKDSIPFTLKNGTNTIDISKLKKAQYIRIKSVLISNLSTEGKIEIPQLNKYIVNASKRGNNASVKWSTKSDWQKGKFTGAAGFLPEGRFEEKGLTGVDFYH